MFILAFTCLWLFVWSSYIVFSDSLKIPGILLRIIRNSFHQFSIIPLFMWISARIFRGFFVVVSRLLWKFSDQLRIAWNSFGFLMILRNIFKPPGLILILPGSFRFFRFITYSDYSSFSLLLDRCFSFKNSCFKIFFWWFHFAIVWSCFEILPGIFLLVSTLLLFAILRRP